MAKLGATMVACVVGVLVSGGALVHALPLPDSLESVLVRVGQDGVINSGEKQWLRQRGFDKIVIAQAVTEAKDGGRLTPWEAQKIVTAFKRRARKNAPDPLDAICKQSPLYPACKNR
jgi:hypothetical protein